MTPAVDPLSQMIEAACERAIQKALNVHADISPRRLLDVKESAAYLSLSPREIYNLINNGELPVVKCGRRSAIDIKDLDAWIAQNKR